MPTKEQKEATVRSLREALEKAQVAVVTDYRGLTVKEMTALRRRLQEAGGEFTVVKNTLIRLVTKDMPDWAAMEPLLEGPTALAIGYEDPVAPAKVISTYAKELRRIKIGFRGGVLQGRMLDEDAVKALANLPSREVLLSSLMGSMKAPMTGMVMTTAGVSRKLVYALEARRKQLAGEAS